MAAYDWVYDYVTCGLTAVTPGLAPASTLVRVWVRLPFLKKRNNQHKIR